MPLSTIASLSVDDAASSPPCVSLARSWSRCLAAERAMNGPKAKIPSPKRSATAASLADGSLGVAEQRGSEAVAEEEEVMRPRRSHDEGFHLRARQSKVGFTPEMSS